MNVILFGAPGAGKGTQGELLARRRDLARLSTGDLLRDAVRRATPLGTQAKRTMEAGELVPDALILGLVREVMASGAGADGYIFDGFPRTLPQAEGLDALLQELGERIDAVIVLAVEDEAIVRRLSGRLSCPACGAIYNRYTDAPRAEGRCDRCGGTLTQRADDAEETVRRRLDVYREQTEPLIAFYRARGVPLHEVDGDGPVESVHEALVARLVPA